MKSVLVLVMLSLVFLAGCSGFSLTPEEVEVKALLDRYGNALLDGDYEEARNCLFPGGPHDQNFEINFSRIQGILQAQPEYSGGVCSLPLFGVKVARLLVEGEWAEVTLESRQVCGFCENSWIISYPLPAEEEYVYPEPPSAPQVSPFNQWVCFENEFLIDSETLLLRKYEGEWRIY
ncbi:hypothetical protein [Atrimonas thermophila]|uniref:hypothetical protein n=1 Tax=Atrimonas thermophila TaxID=3064161 RepID=UPI00399CB92A